jgi:Bromodomain
MGQFRTWGCFTSLARVFANRLAIGHRGIPSIARHGKRMATTSVAARRLVEAVTHAVDADGRLLCESFLELPDRAAYAEYYDAVDAPICVGDIAARLYPVPSSTEIYGVKEARRDLRRLFANSKRCASINSDWAADGAKLEVGNPVVSACSPLWVWRDAPLRPFSRPTSA